MIKTKKISKILAMAIIVSLVFSFSALNATAATSDPNMVAYESIYTYIGEVGTWDYCAFDACPANSSWVPTGFDDDTDAAAATWSVVSESVAGISVYYEDWNYIDGDQGYLYTTIGLIEINASVAGPASIEVKNPNSSPANATTNFTVVADAVCADVSNVDIEVYTGAYDGTPDSYGTVGAVSWNDHYGNTHYPSVMDSAVGSVSASIIDSYIPYYWAEYNSYAVIEMEVNSTDYTNSGYAGWQYRVYDGSGDMMTLSEFIGADEFRLMGGETVVWAYAADGAANFPASI